MKRRWATASGADDDRRMTLKWVSLFGIEMSFLWYQGGLSLLFGIEISFLVSILHSVCSASRSSSSWDQPVRAFLGLDILQIGGQKISIPKRRSKNLDTPKKTSRYQLKESPL